MVQCYFVDFDVSHKFSSEDYRRGMNGNKIRVYVQILATIDRLRTTMIGLRIFDICLN